MDEYEYIQRSQETAESAKENQQGIATQTKEGTSNAPTSENAPKYTSFSDSEAAAGEGIKMQDPANALKLPTGGNNLSPNALAPNTEAVNSAGAGVNTNAEAPLMGGAPRLASKKVPAPENPAALKMFGDIDTSDTIPNKGKQAAENQALMFSNQYGVDDRLAFADPFGGKMDIDLNSPPYTIIADGETLASIAKANNIEVKTLREYNGEHIPASISDTSPLKKGGQLWIDAASNPEKSAQRGVQILNPLETGQIAPYSFEVGKGNKESKLQNTENSAINATIGSPEFSILEQLKYWEAADVWGAGILEKFKKDTPKIALELFEDKNRKVSCEDFCLDIIITFAIQNKLRFSFETGAKNFDINFSKMSEAEQKAAKKEVFKRSGAKDLEASMNQEPVSVDNLQAGDFLFCMDKKNPLDATEMLASHAQFVTEVGLVDDNFYTKYAELKSNPYFKVGDKYLLFTQGNVVEGELQTISQGLVNTSNGAMTRFYGERKTTENWVTERKVEGRKIGKSGFGKPLKP